MGLAEIEYWKVEADLDTVSRRHGMCKLINVKARLVARAGDEHIYIYMRRSVGLGMRQNTLLPNREISYWV